MRSLPFLALAGTLAAQSVVAPDVYSNAEGPSSTTLVWRNGANRAQQVYDTSHFTSQGINYPITITRVQWRCNGNTTTGAAGTYGSVDVRLSSSPNDWASLSTTFANNQGPDLATVYSGPVNVILGLAQAPNIYVVDIPLTTPFTYDPTLGLDLNLEVEYAAGYGATPPAIDAGSTAATVRGARIASTTVGATTGSTSAFVVVCQFDYTVPPGVALKDTYGAGCYDVKPSFYELFAPGAFDLGGSAAAANSIDLLANGNGGYTVVPGSSAWVAPTSPDLALGDDAVSAVQTLSFSFPYPGGSTNGIFVGSNGHLWLATAGAASPATGTPATFLAGDARLSPYWTDLDPSAATGGGSVHFEDDPVNGVATVTWLNVPQWEATPSTPRLLNNVQVAIHSSGLVQFRYLDCNAPTYGIITGFTPGNGARDPGSTDISVAMPFSTGADLLPLAMDASSRPVIGSSVGLVTSNIPATATITVSRLAFQQVAPALDLGAFGMPGCFGHVGVQGGDNLFLFGNPSVTRVLNLPNNPGLVGAIVFGQSLSLVPGVNAFGGITSNGLELRIGSL